MKTISERIDDLLRLWWFASGYYQAAQNHPASFLVERPVTGLVLCVTGTDGGEEAINTWVDLDNQYRAAATELVPILEEAGYDTTLLLESHSMQKTNAARFEDWPKLEAWLKRVKMKLGNEGSGKTERAAEKKKIQQNNPRDKDAQNLIDKINKQYRPGKNTIEEIALAYFNGDEKLAEVTLRTVRNYPHLLKHKVSGKPR